LPFISKIAEKVGNTTDRDIDPDVGIVVGSRTKLGDSFDPEHFTLTDYAEGPSLEYGSHLVTRRQFFGGSEILRFRVCFRFEGWIPEKSDLGDIFGPLDFDGYRIIRQSNIGDINIFTGNVGSFRKGVLGFDDDWTQSIDGDVAIYRIVPLRKIGGQGEWVTDLTRNPATIILFLSDDAG
jgi:hypothetical protein